MKLILNVFIASVISLSNLSAKIPEWFIEDMTANIGVWKASNEVYQSEDENFDAYQIEWEWGIGNTSIIGNMYAIQDDKKVRHLWEFRQYWDNDKDSGRVIQYGNNGIVGIGNIQIARNGKIESFQTFSMPDYPSWENKHINYFENGDLITTSFDKDENEWKERRTYRWIKQENLRLGQFSMSLAVSDIQKSYDFYKNLGFEEIPDGGAISQKWIVLKNKDIKIGLFQGMFPSNTITLNPDDVRVIYKTCKELGIPILFEMGMDKDEGPCSFSITDPDGNPILFDQH